MSSNFDEALEQYREKVGEHLQESLASLPAEQRDILIALVPEAIQSLYFALYQGPDRVGAIRLVLQLTGLVKDKPKGS
jgi:hypothetical protein